MTQTRFVVEAEKTPEILSRIALLFHRCAVDIESFVMQRRKNAHRIRITIGVDGTPNQTPRMKANLNKVVNVLSVKTIELAAKKARRRK